MKHTNEKLPDSPKTVKEAILYYICFAGVRRTFGEKLWEHIRGLTTKQQVLDSRIISPKKKEYLSKAIELDNSFSLEEFNRTKIAGIGVSGIAFINKNFAEAIVSEHVEYTDIGVLGGLQKIYKLKSRPTPKEALVIINTWGPNKSVGNMFCSQVFNYC